MSAGDDQLDGARGYLGEDGIIWRRLAGTAIGSLILAWASGFADFIVELFAGPARLVLGTFTFIGESLATVLRIGIPGLSAGFESARESLLGIGAGPLSFTLGVGFVVLWFWLISVALERVEVFG